MTICKACKFTKMQKFQYKISNKKLIGVVVIKYDSLKNVQSNFNGI